MTQCGRELLIYTDFGAGLEVIQSSKSATSSLTKEQVDITTKDNTWRMLKAGCGKKGLSISIQGLVTQADATNGICGIINRFNNREHSNYELHDAEGKILDGLFEIASIERSGEYSGAELFTITLESAGAISDANVDAILDHEGVSILDSNNQAILIAS